MLPISPQDVRRLDDGASVYVEVRHNIGVTVEGEYIKKEFLLWRGPSHIIVDGWLHRNGLIRYWPSEPSADDRRMPWPNAEAIQC